MDTTSDVFDALSEPRRRYVLYSLADSTTPMDVETLAQLVAKWEVGRPDPGRIQRVHLTLVHNHLPKLADAELVEYDPDERTVRATVEGPVAALVEAARDLDGIE